MPVACCLWRKHKNVYHPHNVCVHSDVIKLLCILVVLLAVMPSFTSVLAARDGKAGIVFSVVVCAKTEKLLNRNCCELGANVMVGFV